MLKSGRCHDLDVSRDRQSRNRSRSASSTSPMLFHQHTASTSNHTVEMMDGRSNALWSTSSHGRTSGCIPTSKQMNSGHDDEGHGQNGEDG